jgi:hypothetical protein
MVAAGMNENITLGRFRSVVLCPVKGVIGRNFFWEKQSGNFWKGE